MDRRISVLVGNCEDHGTCEDGYTWKDPSFGQSKKESSGDESGEILDLGHG